MEVCQICGEKLEIVSKYHCAGHNITKREYREKYGKVIDNSFKIYPRKTLDEREAIGYYIDNLSRREKRKSEWRRR